MAVCHIFRVYNKLLGHQQKRLVISGLRLSGSLSRSLEKVLPAPPFAHLGCFNTETSAAALGMPC